MDATRVTVPMSRGLRAEFEPLERGVLRLTRRGRTLALVVATLLVCIAFWASRLSTSQAATGEPVVQHSVLVQHTVLVSSGETLWSIAVREAPTRDPREVVAAIQQANHLTGVLQAGQKLVLPAP